MAKINYPKINKNIQDFIYEEEGNISRDKVLFIGSMLIILAAMIPSKAFAGHRSHSSHASHSSHTSSAPPPGHASHESHASHASHTSSTGVQDPSLTQRTSDATDSTSISGTHSAVSAQADANTNTVSSTNSSSSTTTTGNETVTQTPGTPQIPDPTPKM